MPALGFVEPMKARLVERPPAGDWIYEIKHDGFRTLAVISGKKAQLFSRNNKDLGGRFPEIAAAVSKIRVKDAIIDGEIVAIEPNGKSSFQLLQAYDIGTERPPIRFYAFDLLRLNGKDLTNLPLLERKAQLEKLLNNPPEGVCFSDSLEGDVDNLLEQARALGLEGLIGKRKDSTYEIGARSGSWIKLKLNLEQEFVIGGYTDPGGSRKHFGSLLVGYYDKEGKLICVGKVGTGFNEASLKDLLGRMKKIAIPDCPFANLPEPRGSRWSPGITRAIMKLCHWCKPELVGQFRYTEWTRDNKLRHPVYLGLRHDKKAREVIRERPE